MLLDPERSALAYRLMTCSPCLAPTSREDEHRDAFLHARAAPASIPACAPRLRGRRPARAARRGAGAARLRAAVAGTHPFAQGEDAEVSGGERYRRSTTRCASRASRADLRASRARRRTGSRACDPRRGPYAAHLPLILAASGNSPYWRGRDSGITSFRTPLFQGFARSGVPRRFGSYGPTSRQSTSCCAPRSSPSPPSSGGTCACSRALAPRGPDSRRADDRRCHGRPDRADPGAGAAQATEGYAPPELVGAQEVLEENRFIAARDGMDACLIDVASASQVPVRRQLEELLAVCSRTRTTSEPRRARPVARADRVTRGRAPAHGRPRVRAERSRRRTRLGLRRAGDRDSRLRGRPALTELASPR